MIVFHNNLTRETQDTMTETKKASRKRDSTKKIVSLTLDPVLVARVDEYAAEKKISRSAAIETAITGLLAPKPITSLAIAENNVALSNDCIFASPQLGTAIHY